MIFIIIKKLSLVSGKNWIKTFYHYTNHVSKNGHKIKRIEKLSEVKRQNSDCLIRRLAESFRILVKRAVVFHSIYFKTLIFLVLDACPAQTGIKTKRT